MALANPAHNLAFLPDIFSGTGLTENSILDSAEVAINYCTSDHIIAYANRKHAALHGMAQDQIIGRPIENILGAKAYKMSLPYYDRVLRGEKFIFELETDFLAGMRYIQCLYNPIFGNDNKVKGWVGVIIDMTERRKLEKALQANEGALRLEKEKAEAANAAKTAFLANISHELRTPLSAIIGFIDILLMREYPPEKQREYLKVMQTSSGHLMQLINDLLDLTKLEAGQEQLEAVPIDLIKIIEDVITINAGHAKQKGICLSLKEIPSDNPPLLGDPLRLRQVLMNLVGNAVKFTSKGGVTLALDYQESETPGFQDIEITVTDTGIGIQQNQLDKIFNKFTQADGSISRSYGGTGLGLSITKVIIQAMGGSIQAQSKHGKGSCFTIRLSLPINSQDKANPGNSHSAQVSFQKACADFHILLVEDNNANVLVATALLDIYGYTYSVAREGKDALKQLKERPFDLVLMDVQMPGMDGFKATRLFREYEKSTGKPRMPIVGMTAHSLAGDRERCIQAGMDDYISKPFHPDQFCALLESYAIRAGKKEASS